MIGPKRRVDYNLGEALAPALIYGAGATVLLWALGTMLFRDPETPIIIALVFVCLGAWQIRAKVELAKKFTLKADNKFTINDVKDYFGTPVNVIMDHDLTYYTFTESNVGGLLGIVFNTTHIFTADKEGNIIKHEMEL